MFSSLRGSMFTCAMSMPLTGVPLRLVECQPKNQSGRRAIQTGEVA